MNRFLLAVFLMVGIISTPGYAGTLQKNREVMNQIGSRLAFFEKKYGPYKNEYENEKYYEIDDCEFSVVVNKENIIRYITLQISKKCDVTPKNSDLGPVGKLKISDFYYKTMESEFLKPFCLLICGNAAEPTITFLVNEPHVAMFISRILVTKLPEGLGEIVSQRVGSQKAESGRYNIDSFQDVIRSIAKDNKILEYGEGYALEKTDIRQ